MLSVFTVCFFGHHHIENFCTAEERTEALVRNLIQKHEYVEFLVGRDGEYDQIVSSMIQRAKREVFSENSSHIWVLPYMKAELEKDVLAFETYYDSIEICEKSCVAHPKAAIQIRNRCMVDRSDLCVFFVENPSGGAWRTLQYAIRKNKNVINLSESR